jgi:oligopeptide transport system substrate-binding protein
MSAKARFQSMGDSMKHAVHCLVVGLMLGGSPSVALADIVLNRGNGGEPATLDPHHTDGRVESNILRDLFEGLTVYGADGSISAGVAERWEASADGKSYVFYLRGDAKWSNGDPVTADDFVYSFRRAVSPEFGGYAADFRIIQNAGDVIAGKLPKDKLGVSSEGPTVFKVALNTPAPYFLSLIASSNVALPVHRATVESGAVAWSDPAKFVSNGAYVLSEWKPKQQIVLNRNKFFHAKSKVGIDKVIFHPVEDANEELSRFLAGKLDIANEVPQEQVRWISNKYPQQFWNKPFLATYYYALNLTAEPFKGNASLRRALSLAVDRERITDKVTRAGEMPAYSLVPPIVANYTQQKADFVTTPKPMRIEEARRLFAKAGYSPAQPLRLNILYNASENNRTIAQSVISMWEDAFGKGVVVTTESVDRTEYLKRRDRRDFQVVRAAWIGDFADPGVFLNLMMGDAKPPRNDPGYNNPQYDALLAKAAETADATDRSGILAQAERLLAQDIPIIPIYHYATKSMVNPKLKGWMYNVRDVHSSRFLSFAE